MGQEQRRHQRFPYIVETVYTGEGISFSGRITDLSASGIFIDTLNPAPEGSILQFSFCLPDDLQAIPIIGEGQVSWMQDMVGMGVQFTYLSETNRGRIARFLSRKAVLDPLT
jgi:hypothetical protein